MWLQKITLYNFGSYESFNSMELEPKKGRNIILIGGKNGAGKTTLFTAIKLCLYGHWEAGYKTTNAYYRKRIRQIINEKAKQEKGASSYVELEFEIVNGNEKEQYSIKRQWNMEETDFEKVEIKKNGVLLKDEEENDFNNFLLMYLPPSLLNLYFFDGEQIANYFLDEGGTARTKSAVLTLCGYDTFEIMLRNFRRINQKNSNEDNVIEHYFQCLDVRKEIDGDLQMIESAIQEREAEFETLESELQEQNRLYVSSGGISRADWENMRVEVKYQEKIRDDINSELKKKANDEIPFIILRKQLEGLRQQILKEKEYQRNIILKDSVTDIVLATLNDCHIKPVEKIKIINQIQRKIEGNLKKLKVNEILKLSQTESDELLYQIENYLAFDKQDIFNLREKWKAAINYTKKIKDKMERQTTDSFEDYKERRIILERQMEEISVQIKMLTIDKEKKKEEKEANDIQFKVINKRLEERFKQDSIHELSARSILFLESLQKKLLKVELKEMKRFLLQKLHDLMRKENFIEAVEIDENFNIHIFKRECMDCSIIIRQIKNLGIQRYTSIYGKYHCRVLLESMNYQSMEELLSKSKEHEENQQVNVLYEIDKDMLSMGEKQVLIMALYWSITQLCKRDIPFIIDTPFARIDSEHRENIAEHFFKDLKGQVFILSTNEEIEDSHIHILEDKLLAFYLLENEENQKTRIVKNHYFGEHI